MAGSFREVELVDFGGAPRAADGGSFLTVDGSGCRCFLGNCLVVTGGFSFGVSHLQRLGSGSSSCQTSLTLGDERFGDVWCGGVASRPAWSSQARFFLGTSTLE